MASNTRSLRSVIFWLAGLCILLPAVVYASSQDARRPSQGGTIPPGNARIDIAHFAPFAEDPADTAVTVRVNGADAVTNLQFSEIVSDVILPSGTYSIEILPSGSPTGSVTLSGTVVLSESTDYLLAAIGDNDNQPLELFTLAIADEAVPAGARLRIGHFAPFAIGIVDTEVDVCTEDNTVVVPALVYKEVTDPALELPAGDYDLKLALGGTDCQDLALDLPALRFSAGETVDLYAIGDVTNQPLQIASTTGFTEAPDDNEGKARITLAVDAEPESRRNFRFAGDLGEFKLDDEGPNNDDEDQAANHDDIRRRKSFRVDAGVYNVGEITPYRWQLTAINCEGGSTAVNLDGEFVAITAASGDEITCTFVNERDVTIRARKYYDANDNSQRDGVERGLPGWTMTLYDAAGNQVATGVTNIYGKANFRFLRAGSYTVCETQQTGWTNTQPGRLNPDFDNQPCYTFDAAAAEMIYLHFGNLDQTPSASAAAGSDTAYNSGIIHVPDPYVDEDDANYNTPADDADPDLNQPGDPELEQARQAEALFMPMIHP